MSGVRLIFKKKIMQILFFFSCLVHLFSKKKTHCKHMVHKDRYNITMHMEIWSEVQIYKHIYM